jgi:hypothetical protein
VIVIVDFPTRWSVAIRNSPLPGFILAGVGAGIVNTVIADVALSVVPTERSGMAARAGFLSGLDEVLLLGGGLAVLGAILAAASD